MSRIFFPRGGACVRSAGRPAVTSLAAAAFLAACIYAHAIAFSCALDRALATCLVKVFLAEAACCIICERGNCLLRMRIRRQCATCVGYVCGANGQIYRQTRLMLQLIKCRLVRDGPNSSEDTACWCQLRFATSGSSPQSTTSMECIS